MSLRSASIDRLEGASLEALVVGAGINGAVSAAALAASGARVGLVDAGDFAGFTSQASSNLIWGGIKYLENYEFGLVRHLCRSRNRLLQAYPSSVEETRFLATLDRSAPFRPWFLALGTTAYWLIGQAATRPPALLSRRAIRRREPIVALGSVRGGVEYSDAHLVEHDARFVFGFVRSALNAGAAVANYVRVIEARRTRGWWEARLRDEETGHELELRARVLVNATGPFADSFNEMVGVTTRHRVVLSKGVHLIVPRIGTNDRVLAFFDDTDRLFFVIPLGDRSVIGTTDTPVTHPETETTDEDRSFLLGQVNDRLHLRRPLTTRDVIAERCGVRPLVVEEGRDDADTLDWTAMSRRHVLEVDQTRQHLTIFGGKITDCLNVGRAVHTHATGLGLDLGRYRRDWYGEPGASVRDEFIQQARRQQVDRDEDPRDPASARLWRRHGLQAFGLLETIRDDPAMAQEVVEGTGYLRCEVEQGARTEMITRFEDYLRRRSSIALLVARDELAASAGLRDACRMLFGPEAERRHDEYFGDHQQQTDRGAATGGPEWARRVEG